MLTFLAMSSVRTLNAIVASQNDQIAEFTGGKNKNVASLHREKLLEKAHMAKINKEQRIQVDLDSSSFLSTSNRFPVFRSASRTKNQF